MTGIEFLPEEQDDGPADLELDGPRAPRHPFAWVARAALAAAVVAALAVWVVTRPSDTEHATASSTALPTAADSGAPSEHRQFVTWSCSTGTSVQRDVAAAMGHFLPSITIESPATLRCVQARTIGLSRVVSETVYGSYQEFGIRVVLRLPHSPAPPDTYPPEGVVGNHPIVVLGTSEAESAGLRVTATATGSSETVAPLTRMQALVEDLCLNVVL